MSKCKKCNQDMPYSTAHRSACSAITQQEEAKVAPPASINEVKEPLDKLDKVTEMLGAIITKQDAIDKRLDKIEQPNFKPFPDAPRVGTVQQLETTLAIAKETQVQPGTAEQKCAFGIHYPSDWGQKRVNGGGEGPLTLPAKRCFPAPPALQAIVNEYLTSEFGADVLPDPYNSTFMFSIIVPPKYCIKEDYRSGNNKDCRVKVISNYAAEPEVRAWCERVKKKIYTEHMQAQLPSPFTVPSMRTGTVVGDMVGPMTPQSFENYSSKLVA